MVDPIADLLTRIRNAGMARHASTRVPHSKIKETIVQILKDEGYIDSFSVDGVQGPEKHIVVYLKYIDGRRMVINEIKRISKPGRRVYFPAKELPKVRAGLGVSIVSSSKGVMSDRQARKLNVGGEILCEVW